MFRQAMKVFYAIFVILSGIAAMYMSTSSTHGFRAIARFTITSQCLCLSSARFILASAFVSSILHTKSSAFAAPC